MSFTYQPDFSGNLWRDALRCLLQEIDEDDLTLSDEEMDGFRSIFGETEGAAKCAEAVAMKMIRLPLQYANTRGGTSVAWVNRGAEINKLAASFRTNGFHPTAGGARSAVAAYGVTLPSLRDAVERQSFLG